MTTLVTGSRGRIGSALVTLLHHEGRSVRAASRRPQELAPPDGVPAVACDLGDPATFAPALEGADSVFLYAEPSHITEFVTAAERAGVEHIVLLSSSSVLAPDPTANPVAALHHTVEQALIRSSLTTTLLRPGAFAGNARQWSAAFRAGRPVELPYPDSGISPIDEADIAASALAVLTDPRLRGGAHHLTGPASMTVAEQVEVIGRVCGNPVGSRPVTRETWLDSVASFIPADIAVALLDHLATTDGRPDDVTGTVQELTGRLARTFADWAADHADAFRP
ncbi:SDR family oxidoreductase [Streptomyces sp. NPDC057682]|uniref:SDR family oxidoreductase n=1 Tax=Streptomyces sp. NPDC057682 TaxID=3346210 RepID=UPI0036BC9B72